MLQWVARSTRAVITNSGFSFAVIFADKRSKRSIYTNRIQAYDFGNALSYGSNTFLVISIGECHEFWDQEVACSNHVAPTVSAVETNR